MFNPKKTIPKLAVAMLALTGCGGDGGGGNGGAGGIGGAGGAPGNGGAGGGGADFDASLNAYCMKAPCFDYTAEVCIDYYNALNVYNDNANCTALLISYFDCGATKTCNQLFQGDCDVEYYAADAACIDIP